MNTSCLGIYVSLNLMAARFLAWLVGHLQLFTVHVQVLFHGAAFVEVLQPSVGHGRSRCLGWRSPAT